MIIDYRIHILNQAKELKICVLIPTYNNEKHVLKVVDSVLEYIQDIIVVNDGSTDSTLSLLSTYSSKIHIISYSENKGKGYAIQRGFREAVQLGFDYALTIDSDGQHYASDIPKFIETISKHPDSLLIGSRILNQENMPQKNTFANKFSNFWFTVQTGKRLPDTQTGFRLYPLKRIRKIHFFTNRYETELEILVRCAWKNINLIPIAINVFYAAKNERITHFRPFKDFARISILNTVFSILAFIYGYPSIFYHRFLKRSKP